VKVNENQSNAKSYSDLVKFGVFLLILAGVILVVSLLRPLIFGRIVPAIIGDGMPTAPLNDDKGELPVPTPELDAPLGYPAPGDEPVVVPVETGDGAAAYPGPDSSTTMTDTVLPPVAFTDYITHTLQPGENLTRIADQYGITIAEIIQANPEIANPDNIQAGTPLRIPVRTLP